MLCLSYGCRNQPKSAPTPEPSEPAVATVDAEITLNPNTPSEPRTSVRAVPPTPVAPDKTGGAPNPDPPQQGSETGSNELEVRRDYWPDGKLKSEKQVKSLHGTIVNHGPWTLWHENGRKQAEGEYADGKLDGLYQDWHDNGQLRAKGRYAAGKKVETFTSWDAQGVKRNEWQYVAGKQHGPRTVWYPNGRLKSRIEYVNGKMHGRRTDWDEDGTITNEVDYTNGQPTP